MSGEAVRVLARSNRLGGARLGMAISRKRVPKAVCRNRIKRVIRDSFRHHRRELGDLDIVVLSGPGLGRVGNAELRRLLAGHWSHLSLADSKRRGGRAQASFRDAQGSRKL